MGYKLKRILIYPDGVTEKQVYPKYEWTPGDNTLAYYKFENNLNDSSGNGYNLSMSSGTFTYGTVGNKSYVILTPSAWSNYVNIPFNNQAHTFSVRVNGYRVANLSWGIVLDCSASGITPIRVFGGRGTKNLQINSWSFYDANWHLFTVVCSGGTATTYDNGGLLGSTTVNSTSSLRFKLNNAWDTSSSSYSGYAYISDFIQEKKARTAQEIADYYNSTKSQYGL